MKGGAEKEEAGEERLGKILEASRIVKCQRKTPKKRRRKPKGSAKRGKPQKEHRRKPKGSAAAQLQEKVRENKEEMSENR